jgi:endonuclease/exonuclease/phosphatase family metal-dependent hydrolase
MVVAGDFNQSLDGSRYYGTASTRKALAEALEGSNLRCVTTEDVVAVGKLVKNHLVDHVCLSADLKVVNEIACWESWAVASDGTRTTMSDHPGLALQLARAEAS